MASIGETKARLLRGAVQDNIATVQGVRIVRTKPQARRRFGVWIFGALSAIALVYLLAVPAQFLPNRASVQSTTPVSAAAINVDLTPEATVPLSHPQPIDRTVRPRRDECASAGDGHDHAEDTRAPEPGCRTRDGAPRLFIMASSRSRSFSKPAISGPSRERPRGSLMRIGSTKRPLTRIS